LNRLPVLGDTCPIHSLSCVDVAEAEVRSNKTLIHFERLLQKGNRLIVTASRSEGPADVHVLEEREGVKLPGNSCLGYGFVISPQIHKMKRVKKVSFGKISVQLN